MQCSTPIIEPCVPCKHPLEYLFENAYKATLGLENKVSFIESLFAILDVGLFVTNCNICCPSCTGTYILTNVETFLLYSENVQFLNNDECCKNFFLSTEAYLVVGEAYDGFEIFSNSCCNTSFNECLNKLICWINKPEGSSDNLDRILDKGVIEYDGFYDKCTGKLTSGLCYIAEFLKKNCDLRIGVTNAQFLDLLLERGIVVECRENQVFIGSVQTYLQYAEAVG
ncbi:MAG: hypothetical protein ACK5XN_12585 [Bacteroidota bacterium]|jgi:hypothetical protein